MSPTHTLHSQLIQTPTPCLHRTITPRRPRRLGVPGSALHAQSWGLHAVSAVSVGAAAPPASSQQQHLLQHPTSQLQAPPPAGTISVTWPGLLAALGLAATALISAAVTCFFLWIKPVMQAMSVTLAEMEAASKEMQQAAQEVEELVGGINSAIRSLMQPTSLLKWNSTSSTPSSSTPTASTTSNPFSSSDAGGSTAAGDALSSSAAGLDATGAATTISSSGSAADFGSSTARQLTNQLEVLAPGFVDGLRGLSKLQLADLALAALKLSGLEEAPTGPQQRQQLQQRQQQRGDLATQISTALSQAQAGSSSGRMVWDMLSSSLSTRSTRRSLARLRSDLAAAVNVLGVLLAPPNSPLYEQLQQDAQLWQRSPSMQGKQQQEQQQQEQPPGHEQVVLQQGQEPSSLQGGAAGDSSGPGTSGKTGRGSRAAVQYDEWGLPMTAAELAAGSDTGGSAATHHQQPSTSQAGNGADEAAASRLHEAWLQQQKQQQQQQQQQQRQQQHRRPRSPPSSDEEAWHLDLAQYGSYLEQEQEALAQRADSGITLQQLQQDPALMQRVFCDNQELAFTQQLDKRQQQQQQAAGQQQQAAGQQPPASS